MPGRFNSSYLLLAAGFATVQSGQEYPLHTLRFNPYMTDAPDDVVVRFGSQLDWKKLDRISRVVGTEDQVAVSYFHVLDGAGVILADGVHILFALTVRGQRVVVAVNEYAGAGEQARIHAHPFTGVRFDYDKALP